ncbi:SDR family oxidoreductase [Arenicella xantha]|uniref:NAD(P)-dependent dehydrogenase (Short-subunit alcohol dehydrogenase family) n=1 Tax=Arenicella xantha TaxID=644221 RepID=A0A395JHQ9_9GAMM|nr:SDR family oxidoreductase [Arenicella xantha]RBP49119.1 NAD(P)-dependent dehydrogenase (short-subunit alcohol dehydrogenase family) [Arenicella xantha]
MKKVLITGAGSGLGRALALRYGQAGADVCVADVNQEGGQETVSQIEAAGGSAFFQGCDITQQWDVDKLAIALAERWQSLDVLVNNAGVASAGSIESERLEQWQWVLEINLLGQVRMTKAMLPLLRKSTADNRDIINIASQAGLTPAPGMGSYSVTKAAMVSFAETAHLEFAHEGIHVSVVCPSFFDTNLNQSLRSDDAGMQAVVTKMIKKSGVSADSIAEQVIKDVHARKFMVITHKEGRKAHRLKRFLPIERYLKIVKDRTKKFVKAND